MNKTPRPYMLAIPPWIILGALALLVAIFLFWTIQNIHKQKEDMMRLLTEKGDALIRSFEAGTRTGMLGMMGIHGGRFQLQRLLIETAQQPDIIYIIVTDLEGNILAHSDPEKIGRTYGKDLDLKRIHDTGNLHWQHLANPGGSSVFEVCRRFSPSTRHTPPHAGPFGRRMMEDRMRRPPPDTLLPGSSEDQIIFLGLDMGPMEADIKAHVRHTVAIGVILLVIGFAGIVTLFLAQAYRTAKSSLTRVKVFSDTVVENMPIGLLAVDPEGKIISFNQAAESILGPSNQEVLGRKVQEVLPEQLHLLVGDIAGGRGTVEKEIECPLENGRKMPMDVSVSRLEGDDGAFLGYIILFRDLTELQDLKKEVERNQRLASLGRLAAGVAHEIRNPLSSIKGFATYFKERYRDIPEDQGTAEIMIREVERLNRVITQLLDLARPIEVRKRPASLEPIIQRSLKMIHREATEKGIMIHTNLSPVMGEVPVDEDRINQVLLNLYLNAIESMEEGGTLSVDLSKMENDGRVKIVVSDTGMGISREHLVHVFDPYFTTKQSGTGLGLAIVHKIVESHGGEVKVESEVGKGTTVTVFIPY